MLFAVATTPQKVRAITNCDVPSALLAQTTKETELLGLINTYRQQNNLGALTWSDVLKKAAAWQSNDMSTHNSFSHTDSLGRNPEMRIKDCGYQFTAYGENIEMGDTTAQAVLTAWKNSPTHNAIMLLTTVRDAGIASVNNYWTLDVGSSNTPIPTGSVITPSPTTPLSDTPSPTPTPEVNTNPTDTQIDVSIKLPGIGETGNKQPMHLTREVTIGIFDSDNKLVLTGNGFLKYDRKNLFEGVIHLGQLANGVYSIKIKATNTLVSLVFPKLQNLTSDNITLLPFT